MSEMASKQQMALAWSLLLAGSIAIWLLPLVLR